MMATPPELGGGEVSTSQRMAFGLIVGAQNFANFGLIAGKIGASDEAAVTLHVGNQHLGCFAAIKIGRAVFSDALQGGGQFRLAENISDLIRLAVVPFDCSEKCVC